MPAARRRLNAREGAGEEASGSSLPPLTPSQQTHAGALVSTTPLHTPLARRSAAAASSPYARTPTSTHRAAVQRTPNASARRLSVPRTSAPPQSPAMRAFGGLLGLISPFSRLGAKRSAAFGTPDPEHEEDVPATQQFREPLASGSTQQHLSSGEHSSNGLPRSSGDEDYGVFTEHGYVGGAMRASQSTPAGLHNYTAAHFSPQPPISEGRGYSPAPPHSPDHAHHGYQEEASEQGGAPIETPPRAPAPHHAPGDSPLARNYELLSRFFAEKAAPQDGQTLTEMEVQGCVRLLEESMAHPADVDVERLRAAAALRNEQAWSAAGSSVRNEAMRRSPSLPLGAAATEGWRGGFMRSNIAYQSRPSTSFLAPRQAGDKYNTAPTDAKFAKSLANSFSAAALAAAGPSAPAPSPRRRPLYLGPGLGRGSASALSRRAARTSLAARPTVSALRDAPRAPVPAAEEHTKRRRLQQPDAAADAPATFLQPSTPVKSALPTGSAQGPPASASANTTPARTATASAMLSILSSSPALPESPRARRPEVVNPYEPSRLSASAAGRKSAEPSTGLSARANALRAAKEETRKRKADAVEVRRKAAQEPRRESALERIERTAPTSTPAKKRAVVQTRESGEDKPDAEPLASSAAAEKKKEDEKEKEKAARKARATEEAWRRISAMQQSSSSSSSDSSTPTSSPTQPAAASAPFTFAAPKPSQAFAPKKPSPLSLPAFKPAPDSPGSSSESEEARSAPASGSSQNTKQAPPKLAFNFGAPKETDKKRAELGEPVQKAKPAEPEKEDEEMSAPTPAPASAPAPATFNFGQPAASSAPAASASRLPFASSSSAAPTHAAPPSPRAQALSAPPTLLPTFALHLSAPAGAYANMSGANAKAKVAPLGELPSFSFQFDASGKASLGVEVTSASSSAQGPAASSSSPAPAASSAGASEDAASADGAASAPPSSGLLAASTGEGEEGESTTHEVRGKVWALQSGTWKDLGVGLVKVKRSEEEGGKRRLLVRNEVTGKPTVNFNLYAALTIKQEANVITFTGFADGQPMNYRTKIKTAEGAAQLKAAMEAEAALCK